MRIVKVGVLAPTNKGIPLGVQGENRATQVEFDTRPWFREYPYGTVSAVARRDGDNAPYPLTLDVADGTAVWQVSDTDTAKAGEGAVELTMTSAGARVRSLTFKTLVTASLTDSPVDDDAWYGWLDKAVVKVDETVQSAQRKMAEVDEEWTGLKADVTSKVDECGKVAAQAAQDAHHAKVDAQATVKALESAEGSVAKAEAAANRAVNASIAADDSAVEASRSALSAGESADAAAGSAANAATSASEAATSAGNAADAASAASGSASAAAQSATDAINAKVAAQTAKAEAETAKGEAATSASNAESSATAAAKSASDAAKTLTEAKQYTDANSSNALVGTVSGKLLHVEDAWPSPVRELVVYGKSVQNGTPTPDAPVPIESVSKLSVVSTGKNLLTYPYYSKSKVEYGVAFTDNGDGSISVDGTNTSSTGAIFDIIVPGNNSAYSIFPAGTYNAYAKESISNDYAIYFSIRRDTYYGKELLINGNNISGERSWRFTLSEPTRLFIRIGVAGKKTVVKTTVNVSLCASEDTDPYYPYVGSTTQNLLVSEDGTSYELRSLPDGTRDDLVIDKDGNVSLTAIVGKTETAATDGVNATVGTDAMSSTGAIADGATVYYKLATPITYQLGKITVPSLPDSISNVWTEAELTTDMSMTYKRDINIAFDNLVQAVVAAAAGE